MVGETWGPGEAGTLASGEDGCYSVETVEGDTPGMDVGSCYSEDWVTYGDADSCEDVVTCGDAGTYGDVVTC